MQTRRRFSASMLVGLSLMVAACSGGQSTPAAAPPSAPPAAPAAAKPAESAPSPAAAAASPAASPAVPTVPPVAVASASPAASPAAVVAVPPGGVRLTLAGDGSEARFRAREQLAGKDAMSDAVGTTSAVSGNIVLGPQGAPLAEQSKLVVDLTTLKSDESRRDNYIKNNTLQTAQFPNAELVVRQLTGLPWPLPTSGSANFQLQGDLTVHGVTKPTTWDVQATLADREVSGQAKTGVKITDFGMPIPRVTVVLSVNDDVGLEINFKAAKG
jgi:polyisoprenoid-binding protein YceI